MSGPQLTRSKIECPIFGSVDDLSTTVFPTVPVGHVLGCYLYIRNKLKFNNERGKEPTFADISKELLPKIISVWKRSSIPTIPSQ